MGSTANGPDAQRGTETHALDAAQESNEVTSQDFAVAAEDNFISLTMVTNNPKCHLVP